MPVYLMFKWLILIYFIACLCGNYFVKIKYLFAMTNIFETEQQFLDRIEAERLQLKQKIGSQGSSPLSQEQLAKFSELSFFPPDARFKVKARLKKVASQISQLTLSNGQKQDFVKYGMATFQLDGNDFSFEVFMNKNLPELSDYPSRLFIPFCDGTCGKSTHDDGRIVCLDDPGNEEFVEIDFNCAYNTYNAYNTKCVSVTASQHNRVRTDFSIGQRKFEDRI